MKTETLYYQVMLSASNTDGLLQWPTEAARPEDGYEDVNDILRQIDSVDTYEVGVTALPDGVMAPADAYAGGDGIGGLPNRLFAIVTNAAGEIAVSWWGIQPRRVMVSEAADGSFKAIGFANDQEEPTDREELLTMAVESHIGESILSASVREVLDEENWEGYYPEIDTDLNLTGCLVDADGEDDCYANYAEIAMINAAAAIEAGWTVADGSAYPPEQDEEN